MDKPELKGNKVLGYSIIGTDSDLKNLAKKYRNALVTAGQIKSPKFRIKLFNLAVRAGFAMPSIISPNAYVSKHSKIGSGTIVMNSAIVNSNTVVGKIV